MCAPWWLLASLLSIIGTVPMGTASASALPEPGARIRLTAKVPKEKCWIGPLVSMANDTVTLSDGDTTLVAVPSRYVTRFEVSRGEHGSSMRKGLIGFVIGACAGTVLGYYSSRYTEFAGAEYYLASGVVVGVGGAAVGAAIGAWTPSEHWRALPLESLRYTSNGDSASGSAQ